MSSSSSSRFAAVTRAPAPVSPGIFPASVSAQISGLYQLTQRSENVFGSPVGPFAAGGRSFHLHRFVYFGPNASEASLRLAFLGGLDHRDFSTTCALSRLVADLALTPELGHGLNLSVFPLVDVLGAAGISAPRRLADENWTQSHAPEIRLLERDARVRGYHGFVRLESARGEDAISIRVRAPRPLENLAPDLELVQSRDFEPFAVRWESDASLTFHDGPLSVADDLPVVPFELTLRIPSAWQVEDAAGSVSAMLQRFIRRHRGFFSYGQHL